MQPRPATSGTASSSSSTGTPVIASGASRSWGASLIGAMARSYRRVISSAASSSVTTTSSPALGERTLDRLPAPSQRPSAGSKEARDAKASTSSPDGKVKNPVPTPFTLAGLWPGHAFARGPVTTVCQALLEQKGQWRKMEIYKALLKLDGSQLAQVGEFAAYLQAHPVMRSQPLLSPLLVELAIPPRWPASELPGQTQGLGLGGHLVTGLVRGLMRTDQTYCIKQVLKRIADEHASLRLDHLASEVVALRDCVPDAGLREVLGAIHLLPLPYEHGLLFQCRHMARSPSVPVADLHRVVRLATCQPYHSNTAAVDWYRGWFRLLETPDDGEGEITPLRQFVVGHAVARARDQHQAIWGVLQPLLDDPPAASGPVPALPPPKPTPASCAGAKCAVYPEWSLDNLCKGPAGAIYLDAWITLMPPQPPLTPVRLYEAVEAAPMPMAQRYRLQRQILQGDGAFDRVRATMMRPAEAASVQSTAAGLDEGPPGTADDALATTLARLADLYRYFGERDGLEFAFGSKPDLARIRAHAQQVRERIDRIEAAVRELQALAPAAGSDDSHQAAFLREGYAQVARVTLGASLRELQDNLARAGRATDKYLDDADDDKSKAGGRAPGDSKAVAVSSTRTPSGLPTPTLENVWPGHEWKQGAPQALCKDLTAHTGPWNAQALTKGLARLDLDGLREVGEFAARLQGQLPAREGPPLTQVLLQTMQSAPRAPDDSKRAVQARVAQLERLDCLGRGILRGLVRSGQHARLRPYLVQLRSADAELAGAGPLVDLLELADHINGDKDLEDALYALRHFPLGGALLAEACKARARVPGLAAPALHRLVRVATVALLKPGGDGFEHWLDIMQSPAQGEAQVSPALSFAIGHAVGSGCVQMDRHNAQGQARIDQAWATYGGEDSLQGNAFSRAGFVMAMVPMEALRAQATSPFLAKLLDFWEAVDPAWRAVDRQQLQQTLAGLPLAPELTQRVLEIALPAAPPQPTATQPPAAPGD